VQSNSISTSAVHSEQTDITLARESAAQEVHPAFTQFLPDVERTDGRYRMRFARDTRDLDEVFKLRFEVFNLELDEGLSESYLTGRDRDEFDEHCHHILVEDVNTGEVVGTYRVQVSEMAARGNGFYTDGEFDLSAMPRTLLDSAIEAGRACVSRPHRNKQVLFLLWKGLASYFVHNEKRYFFGCCSLTSQDPAEGVRVLAWLRANDHMHSELDVPPHPGFECVGDSGDPARIPAVKIPTLFGTYLRYGARLCGPPAIDRKFGTIDFLALVDVRSVNPRVLASLLK